MGRSILLSFTVLLLHLLPSPAVSSSSGNSTESATYSDFLNCLEQRTQSELSHTLYSQSNSSYSAALQSYVRNRRYNTSSTPKPLLILAPSEPSHVSAAVLCSRRLGLLLRTRSGGHDYEGISYASSQSQSDPFLVLDTFNFRSVDVDVAGESAWVGSGATLGELYYRIWEKSGRHGFPAGVCPTVGVGGHFSGGGYGNMSNSRPRTRSEAGRAEGEDGMGSEGEDSKWAQAHSAHYRKKPGLVS